MSEINLGGLAIKHDQSTGRFETHVGGRVAFLNYRRMNGTIIFDHTEVPAEFEGNGIGGRLAQAALEYARSSHLRVVPLCPFLADYLRKHTEYQDLLAPSTLKRLLQT
jgi:predicted GNAT family acetyltransferase